MEFKAGDRVIYKGGENDEYIEPMSVGVVIDVYDNGELYVKWEKSRKACSDKWYCKGSEAEILKFNVGQVVRYVGTTERPKYVGSNCKVMKIESGIAPYLVEFHDGYAGWAFPKELEEIKCSPSFTTDDLEKAVEEAVQTGSKEIKSTASEPEICIGDHVEDFVSGFQGYVVAKIEHISGLVEFVVQAKSITGDHKGASCTFHAKRLKRVGTDIESDQEEDWEL